MATLDDAYALVIGIHGYRHVRPLPVVRDADDLHALLVDPDRGGYPPENARLLHDDEATAEAIVASLADLAAKCDESATVFVYFSGHGASLLAGPEAGAYLLPVDADGASADRLAQTAISGTAFGEALGAIRARRVVVVLDCCHAGGIASTKGAGLTREVEIPDLAYGLPETYLDRLKAGRGRVVFASARQDEFSYVHHGAVYGVFTRHLLAGLGGGAASADGFVRVFDLFEYLQPRVTADQRDQHPVFKADLEENFPVAAAPTGAMGDLPVAGADGFLYDAYLSYVDREPDRRFVWETLVPALEGRGLRVAVSGDVEEPGVARVVSVERGIRRAKRTVIVLSDAYLGDAMATFTDVLAQTLGILEDEHRLLPVTMGPMNDANVPVRLSMLTTLQLAHPQRGPREFERLVAALKAPVPPTGGAR